MAVSDPNKLIPRNGVYAVQASVEGERHSGLLSIGVLPTFYNDHEKVCEVFIYDFDKDIYGKNLTVECVEWIRGEKKFSSAEDLAKEMMKDKLAGRRLIENVQH